MTCEWSDDDATDPTDPRRDGHRERSPNRHTERAGEQPSAAGAGGQCAKTGQADQRGRCDEERQVGLWRGCGDQQRDGGSCRERRRRCPRRLAEAGAGWWQRCRARRARGRPMRHGPSTAAPPAAPAGRRRLVRCRCRPVPASQRLRLAPALDARLSRSACSVSACELTDTYSPAAIESAPAARPATPATSTALRVASAAATPISRLAVDTMPSLAPNTAARSHPMRLPRCTSRARIITTTRAFRQAIAIRESPADPRLARGCRRDALSAADAGGCGPRRRGARDAAI